jgi:hypothetical protein
LGAPVVSLLTQALTILPADNRFLVASLLGMTSDSGCFVGRC